MYVIEKSWLLITCVNEILIGEAWMVNIVDGTSKYCCEYLQIREDILKQIEKNPR